MAAWLVLFMPLCLDVTQKTKDADLGALELRTGTFGAGERKPNRRRRPTLACSQSVHVTYSYYKFR